MIGGFSTASAVTLHLDEGIGDRGISDRHFFNYAQSKGVGLLRPLLLLMTCGPLDFPASNELDPVFLDTELGDNQ
jgi:hypothetical protein